MGLSDRIAVVLGQAEESTITVKNPQLQRLKRMLTDPKSPREESSDILMKVSKASTEKNSSNEKQNSPKPNIRIPPKKPQRTVSVKTNRKIDKPAVLPSLPQRTISYKEMKIPTEPAPLPPSIPVARVVTEPTGNKAESPPQELKNTNVSVAAPKVEPTVATSPSSVPAPSDYPEKSGAKQTETAG